MGQVEKEIAEFEVEMTKYFPWTSLEKHSRTDTLTPYVNLHTRDRLIGWKMAKGTLPHRSGGCQ